MPLGTELVLGPGDIVLHGTQLPLPNGTQTPNFNTWFPGPTPVLNANGISIGSAVFAGLTTVTDRQSDRQTTLLGQ